MKLYIYLTPFLLCFYILMSNGAIFSKNWLNNDIGNPIIENINKTKEELDTSTLELIPLQLKTDSNVTALEQRRRIKKYLDKKFKNNKLFKNKHGERVTRHMARTKGIIPQKRQLLKKRNSRYKRVSRVNSKATYTSPIIRAEHKIHKNKREANLSPNFRQATREYRSTRITPISNEKLQEEKDKELGMNQIMSAYNIENEVTEIIDSFDNVNMTKEVIGRTIEYKDIILVKTTECKNKKNNQTEMFRAFDDDKFVDDAEEQPEKKIILIVHGLSVMGVFSMPCFRRKSHLKKLLSFYFRHLDKFDIYLIPMANPDGYAYAMNNVKIWNKNLSPQAACQGVALDRNFDVSWNTRTLGSSCSQQYPGESPFSEPETRAIRDIFHRYGHKIVAYINVHSGTYDSNTYKGDAVLYPKGYTDAATDDDKYIDLRGEIDEAMKNASFEAVSVYVDTLHSWYGKVSGTSVDYASTVYGVPFAMEFVMQLYTAVQPISVESEEDISEAALVEIWGRVIDTVFQTIYKSLEKDKDI